MKKRFLSWVIPTALLLCVGLVTAAWAAMSDLNRGNKSVSFGGRSFEYGGHISYALFRHQGMDMSQLNIIDHNNDNCGSGQCGGGSVHYLLKCRITAGDADLYIHELTSKILLNGSVSGLPIGTACIHQGAGWVYNAEGFHSLYAGVYNDVYKWRITTSDEDSQEQDSYDYTFP